jgi:hypothetical protein
MQLLRGGMKKGSIGWSGYEDTIAFFHFLGIFNIQKSFRQITSMAALAICSVYCREYGSKSAILV